MNYFLLALKYFPYVLQGVIAVENAISAPGATKKQMVLSSVLAAASVGATVPESHVAVVSQLIDATVGQLNSSGVFGKPAAVAAAAAKG